MKFALPFTVLLSFLLLFSLPASSQGWQPANLPTGIVEIKDMISFEGKLFISTNPHVYSSDDDGLSWNLLSIPYTPYYNFFEIKAGELFIISERFVSKSLDGVNWNSDPVVTTGMEIVDVMADGSLFWAASVIGGLYSSADGVTWIKSSNFEFDPFYSVTGNGLKLFASFLYDPGKIAYSENGGISWSTKTSGNSFIERLYFFNDILFSSGPDGIWRSANNGDTWQKVREPGILFSVGPDLYNISNLTLSISSDLGINWVLKSSQLPPYVAKVGVSLGDKLFLGANGGGVFSTLVSDPAMWQVANGDLRLYRVTDFEYHNGSIFMAAENRGIFSSDDDQTWVQKADENLTPNANLYRLQSVGNDLFALDNSLNFFRTSDNGISWTNLGPIVQDMFVTKLASHNGKIVAAGSNGVYLSENRGSSWQKLPGLTGYIESIASNNENLYCGGSQGLLKFDENLQTWIIVSINGTNPYVGEIILIDNTIIINTDLGILASNDNGETWITNDTEISYFQSSARYSGIYKSRLNGLSQSLDQGATWQHIGINNVIAPSFGFSEKNIFASFEHKIWYRPFQEFAPPFAETDSTFALDKPVIIKFDHKPLTISGNELSLSDINNLFAITDSDQNPITYQASFGEDPLTILLHIKDPEINELYAIDIESVRSEVGIVSTGQTLKTKAELPIPISPTNLVVNSVSAFQNSLTWVDESGFETGYRIERKLISESDFSVLINLSANTVSYQDATVAACTHYQYRVRAFNSKGISAVVQIVDVKTNCLSAINSFAVEGTEDNVISFSRTDFEVNFSDQDSDDELGAIKIQTLPAFGILKLADTPVTAGQEIATLQLDQLRFDPLENNNGATTISVLATEGIDFGTQAGVISLIVNPVNDAPTFDLIGLLEVDEDFAGNHELVVSFNEIPDEINDEITFTLSPSVSDKVNITFNSNTGLVKFTSIPNQHGDLVFTITADDGNLLNNTYSINFTFKINSINDAPVLGSLDDIRLELSENISPILINVQDIDNEISAVNFSGLSSNQTILKNESITFNDAEDGVYLSLMPEGAGTSIVSILVNDGTLQDTKSFEIDVFTVTGSKEDSDIVIFPNPVDKYITILMKSFQSVERVWLIDAVGRKMIDCDISSSETIINAESLQSGVYILFVELKDGKVVKNKVYKR